PSPQVIMVHGLSIPYRLNLAQARQAAQLRTDQCHQMVPGREPLDVFVTFVPLHDRREAPPRKHFQQIAEHRILIVHAKLSILSLINQKDTAKPRRRLACSYHQSIFPRTALPSMGEGRDGGEREYADVPGFRKSASLEDIRKHGHVLTPGRFVGASVVDEDDEPFDEKMHRLVATFQQQQARAAKLDAAIAANLRELGYGG